jgi:DNA ligase (NAD+)
MNDFCVAKLMKRLSLFTSRNAMDIEGMGEKVVEQFFNQGFFHNIAEIYDLSQAELTCIEYVASNIIINE